MGSLPAFRVTLPFILALLKWWLLQTVHRLLQQSSDPLCFRRQSGLLKHIRLVRSFRKSAQEQVEEQTAPRIHHLTVVVLSSALLNTWNPILLGLLSLISTNWVTFVYEFPSPSKGISAWLLPPTVEERLSQHSCASIRNHWRKQGERTILIARISIDSYTQQSKCLSLDLLLLEE